MNMKDIFYNTIFLMAFKSTSAGIPIVSIVSHRILLDNTVMYISTIQCTKIRCNKTLLLHDLVDEMRLLLGWVFIYISFTQNNIEMQFRAHESNARPPRGVKMYNLKINLQIAKHHDSIRANMSFVNI